MSHYVAEMLITHLRTLIRDLGKDDGLIGPSIYDTAQVLRLAPPADGVWDALNWLISQQQPDGGWGHPAFPLARDVPTLAVLLTLHKYTTRAHEREIIRAGVAFLWRHAAYHWSSTLPDALPVAIELLVPRLVDEAIAVGLDVPRAPYVALYASGQKRMRTLANIPMRKGIPPVHTWEAWGVNPDPALIDESGGLGHNPAATAAWLRAAADRPDLADARAAATRYLHNASVATGVGIAGVVPTVWPITRFEQSNALYALMTGGLLDHPQLQDVLHDQIGALAGAFTEQGLGMSDYFMPDGDDTAEALAVMHAVGRPIALGVLDRFAHNNHFCAYHGELQPALSVTAHAVHTLRLTGQERAPAEAYLVERQRTDGSWHSDKWNGSWLYTTGHILIALAGGRHTEALERATHAILNHQHNDGGWGAHDSNPEETAYGIIALRTILRQDGDHIQVRKAVARAEHWMLNHYRPFHLNMWPCWLGKETYRPHRLARMIELVATFPSSDLALSSLRV
jgi:hypothetical protein